MTKEILEKFSGVSDFQKLDGGQGTSVRAGHLAIKPVDEIDKYIWLSNSLQEVSFEGILVSIPVKSISGNWIEGGFGATTFIDGSFVKGRIYEKLKAANLFHQKTAAIVKPEQFDQWESPWSSATKVAWQEGNLPPETDQRIERVVQSLLKLYSPISLDFQFIHSDIAGNIFFSGDGTPIVIDISPAFRPVEYANTMLVTDSIAWHDEPLDSLNLLNYSTELRLQLVLRTVVFRICVPVFFNRKDYDSFSSELWNFRKILDYCGLSKNLTLPST